MERYQECLTTAIKTIRLADHMLYITYPVIKDKRLLLRILDQIYETIAGVINSILLYDYLNKRIELSKNSKENFEVFINKCARRFNISPEELNEIQELFIIVENHRKSPMEFKRQEKVVIMTEELKTSVIEPETLKKYLNLSKKMINKAKFGMSIQ